MLSSKVQQVKTYLDKYGYQRVALQFPDDLLSNAPQFVEELSAALKPSVQLYVLGDTSYNPMAVDEVAAEHVSADCVVHFGPASFAPVTRLPALLVLPHAQVDADAVAHAFTEHLATRVSQFSDKRAVLVLLNQCYHHAHPLIRSALQDRWAHEPTLHGHPLVIASPLPIELQPANRQKSKCRTSLTGGQAGNAGGEGAIVSASQDQGLSHAQCQDNGNPARGQHESAEKMGLTLDANQNQGPDHAQCQANGMACNSNLPSSGIVQGGGQGNGKPKNSTDGQVRHSDPSNSGSALCGGFESCNKEKMQSGKQSGTSYECSLETSVSRCAHTSKEPCSASGEMTKDQDGRTSPEHGPQISHERCVNASMQCCDRPSGNSREQYADPSSSQLPSNSSSSGHTGTTTAGLSWALPAGISERECVMGYIGPVDAPALRQLQLTYAAAAWLTLDPESGSVVEGMADSLTRLLRQRRYMVERVRAANIIGILVGTLGCAGYREEVRALSSLARAAGKKTYTFLVGRPNPAKLGNFPEVDVFVHVADAGGALLESRDYLAPLVTPYEAMLGLSGRGLDGEEYRLGFAVASALENGTLTLPTPDECGDGSTAEAGSELALAASSQLSLSSGSGALQRRKDGQLGARNAAEYLLTKRSFTGLEAPVVGAEFKAPAAAVQGRQGRAAGYRDEPTPEEQPQS